MRVWLLSALLLLMPVCNGWAADAPQSATVAHDPQILSSGWEEYFPFQYTIRNPDTRARVLTGLDVVLMRTLLKRMGHDVTFQQLNWDDHLQALKKGSVDMAPGAFFTQDRASYSYYSLPYRTEKIVLYLKRNDPQQYSFKTPDEFIKWLDQSKFRVGVIKGYDYGADVINQYIDNPKNEAHVVFANTESENFVKLFNNQTDGVLTDEVVGSAIAWRQDWQSAIKEYPYLAVKSDVHMIFSKKTITPAFVERFNQVLTKFKKTGLYRKMVRDYTFPILLAMTLEKPWFLIIGLMGTIGFAMSGLLIAHKERYSLVGACVLAALPALGGGIIRDIMVNRDPIDLFKVPFYIYAVLLTVLAGFIVIQFFRLLKKLMAKFAHLKHGASYLRWSDRCMNWFERAPLVGVFDAFGLAAFTIVGVVIAVEAKLAPLWLWGPVLAVVTSCGGKILREIIRADPNIAILKGKLYAETALVWGLIFSLFIDWQTMRLNPTEIFYGVLGVLVGGIMTQLIALFGRIKGPMYS